MDGEERLLRRAMLWLLVLSALSGPRTFGAFPIEVPSALVALNSTALLLTAGALWLGWIRAETSAIVATSFGTVAALTVFHDLIRVVPADVSTEAAGNVALSGMVALCGIAFIGLRVRGAILASLAILLGHAVVVLVAGEDRGVDLLTDRGIAQQFRFGLTAAVLFLVVKVLSVARARERDAAAAARDAAAERARTLELANAVRSRLHQEAAHELKGPLAVIRATATTLERIDLDDEQRTDLLRTLQHGVSRLDARVGDVISSSAVLDGRDAAEAARIDHLIAAAVEEVGGVIGRDRLELAVDADMPVRIHREDLEHVLENLLSNAAKYGERDQAVRLSAAAAGDGDVIVAVTSAGGMDPDVRERAFDRHWRAGDPGIEGEGVGLALVRRLVTGWGGRAWAEGDEQATTFAFTIPAADTA